MRVLLIHTCGVEGSVAVAGSGSASPVLATAILPARTFSEGLMPAIRSVLDEAGMSVTDLEAVGVVNGPGSFTGVRTGLSVGKGLCEALGIPLAGISRLALLARSGEGETVHAVLDAGRGEFYYGLYRGGIREREALVSREELLSMTTDRTHGGTTLICEEKGGGELEGLPGMRWIRVAEPAAGDALALVIAALGEGANDVLADANYLRRTDGEIFARPAR